MMRSRAAPADRPHTTVFYSTHILDDVQRVSDTVAIMNRGRLVARVPVEQLLSGDSDTSRRKEGSQQ